MAWSWLQLDQISSKTFMVDFPWLACQFNTLRPRQNGRLFADDTFKRIFLNEIIRISIKISLKCVPKGLINSIPALVVIMAWRRPGDKPLSEPMMVSVTRPQWVKIWDVFCEWPCCCWFWLFILGSYYTLYNTVNFCWSTHKRHSIARPKGRGMGCLLWVQRATYCVDLSKLSSIKYLL